MAIQVTPVISNKLYLQEFSDELKELEKDQDETEYAWVMIRQATEADNLRRTGLRSKVIFQFEKDGTTKQEQSTNFRELAAFEVFLTLAGAGNISGVDDKPLFTFQDTGPYAKIRGDFGRFQRAYGQLPLFAAEAMIHAVWSINKNWDWLTTQGEV